MQSGGEHWVLTANDLGVLIVRQLPDVVHQQFDISFGCTIERITLHVHIQQVGNEPEICLEVLTDVHTGRNATWVQQDVERAPIHKARHLAVLANDGRRTFVRVSAGHLIASAEAVERQ